MTHDAHHEHVIFQNTPRHCKPNFDSCETVIPSKSPVADHHAVSNSYAFFFLFNTTCVGRYVYWGEYPLSFAACLGQEESYRLIVARGADPNNQDTNGNTVLHMLVIYEKIVSIHGGTNEKDMDKKKTRLFADLSRVTTPAWSDFYPYSLSRLSSPRPFQTTAFFHVFPFPSTIRTRY